MSTTENPATSIQADVSEQRTELPPPPQAPPQPAVTPELLEQLGRIDQILLALLLGLAFLQGSFSIRNNDLYQNLQVGRLIVQGEYRFGEDPFSWASEPTSWVNALTGEKIVWVNHHWLFGLLMYGLYLLAPGGQALVVFRGLLVTALAGLLVLTGRRPGQRLWGPILCGVLAVLALSPRLFLQPILFSFLFLGLTLYLLERPRLLREAREARGEQNGGDRFGSWWALPPLFVLWVNLDNWFILGPITVGLYLVGAMLQRRFGPASGEGAEDANPARLGWVLAASTAACLINPYHLHAFTLPAQLSMGRAAQTLRQDPTFVSTFASPIDLNGVYFQAHTGLSVVGMSYFVLLALSILALLLAARMHRERVQLGQVLVLLSFAVLSLYNVRAIPFFAVVAGPITALNLQTWWARRKEALPITPRWLLAGRWLAVLAVVLLMVATVPGWLQARPHSNRRVGWTLVSDPSLEKAAQQIKEWRDRGLLPEKVHWFNTNVDVGNALAWYCPGERVFFDSRITLFPEAAQDLKALRALGNRPESDQEGWREVCQRREIHHVLYYTPDLFQSDVGQLFRLLELSNELPLLYMDGRTAIFSWNDPENPDPKALADLKIDMRQLAFGPQADPAPGKRPERAAQTHPWYAELWQAPATRPLDASQAQMALLYYEARERDIALQQERVLHAAGAIGFACPTNSPLHPFRFLVDQEIAVERLRRVRRVPPSTAPLYVAIRAMRRSLAENPDDAQTYLRLGLLYSALSQTPVEASLGGQMPLLRQVRQTQTIAALQQAVKLNPNFVPAHQRLAEIYKELGYLDLWLKHVQELDRVQRGTRPRGPGPEPGGKQNQNPDDLLKALEDKVNTLTNEVDVHSSNRPPLEQAILALSPVEPKVWLERGGRGGLDRHGLAEKALEALGQVPDPSPTVVGIAQTDLLFRLGRLDAIRAGLEAHPEWRNPAVVHPDWGLPAYEYFQILLAAASGDYDLADEEFAGPLKLLADPNLRGLFQEQVAQGVRVDLALRLAPLTARGQPIPSAIATRWLSSIALASINQFNANQLLGLMAREADLWTLRGWLALEAGQVDRAREHLRKALAIGPKGKEILGFPSRNLAVMGLEWLGQKR